MKLPNTNEEIVEQGGGVPPLVSLNNDRVEVLAFEVADQRYALPIDRIREVMTFPSLSAVPRSEKVIRGVFAFRGQILSLLDLRYHLQSSLTPSRTNNRVLIVDGRWERFGVLVERVDDVITVSMEAEEATRDLLRLPNQDYLGVARYLPDSDENDENDENNDETAREEEIILVLNPEIMRYADE